MCWIVEHFVPQQTLLWLRSWLMLSGRSLHLLSLRRHLMLLRLLIALRRALEQTGLHRRLLGQRY